MCASIPIQISLNKSADFTYHRMSSICLSLPYVSHITFLFSPILLIHLLYSFCLNPNKCMKLFSWTFSPLNWNSSHDSLDLQSPIVHSFPFPFSSNSHWNWNNFIFFEKLNLRVDYAFEGWKKKTLASPSQITVLFPPFCPSILIQSVSLKKFPLNFSRLIHMMI